MKTLAEYIKDINISTLLTEAAKPVKEFEAILGMKLPSKAKVDKGILTFDMPDKKWKGLDGWWYEFNTSHKGNIKHIKSLKDEFALHYIYNGDTFKGKEKWIDEYEFVSGNDIYTIIVLQVRDMKSGKDHMYITIKK